MFSDEEKEEVKNFMSYMDEFEEDRKKRLESIKRIDKLLGNSNSFEESTKWKVEGKDEV
jgi:uncharacterized protein YnzC (UPF0291/DUF896 family)